MQEWVNVWNTLFRLMKNKMVASYNYLDILLDENHLFKLHLAKLVSKL